MRTYLFAIFWCLFLLLPQNLWANEVVSCGGKVYNVMVEAGHLPGSSGSNYPNAVEQDIGGDYDENAPTKEWNFLNLDDKVSPVVAHCTMDKNYKHVVDINVPKSISRCLLAKGVFTCMSGTVSFADYVDSVRFERTNKKGDTETLMPIEETQKGVKTLVWKNLDKVRQDKNLVAFCYQKVEPNDATEKDRRIEIPADMKECSLKDRRFRCTATPNRHNLFWP